MRAEASLDDVHGDERQDDRDQDRRGDPEVEVRREVDRLLRVDERTRVVRDLGQDAVERRDQEVDAEAGGDAREGGGHARERVTADAFERSRAQGYQHEVPRIRGNAREDADEDEDRRQHRFRRDLDELPDQRPDQSGGLGEADADHHDEDDRDGSEVAEVGDERREEEADSVCGQQALDCRRFLFDRVLAFLDGRVRQAAGRLRGTARNRLLDGDRRRLDDLVGDLDVRPGEQGGEDDDDHAQPDEQDRGVRHLVPAALDRAQDPLHHRRPGGGRFRCARHGLTFLARRSRRTG